MIHLRDQDVIAAVCFYLIILILFSTVCFTVGWFTGRRYWKKIVDSYEEGYK